MPHRTRPLALVCALALALLAPGGPARAAAPVPVDKGPTPLITVLDNGLTIVALEHHTAPVVTVQGWVRAGSTTEGDELGAGLSHFLEHMLFKGTERRDVGQMGADVKAIGGYTNAYTSHDRTVFYINCDAAHVNDALDILTDVLNHATFAPEEVERERGVIFKEMNRAEDSPMQWGMRALWGEAYLRHPYRYPVIGYQGLLAKVTRDDLVAYYKREYVPNNLMLVIVGDVNAEAVTAEATRLWRDIPRRSLAVHARPQEPRQLGPRDRVVERDSQLAHVFVAWHGPALTDPDLYPMDVLSIVLGEGRSSRLYRSLREEQELAHAVSASSYTPRDPGLFSVYLTTDPDRYDPATDAALAEVDRIRRRGITAAELARAKRLVLAGYYQNRQTAEDLASALGSAMQLTGDPSFDAQYVAGIQGVDTEAVRRVARTYLRETNRTRVVVVPKGTLAATRLETPVTPVGEPTVHTLANGLRVIIRENHTAPLVSLRAAALGGLRADPPDQPGLTNLMSALLTKGTARWSAAELADAVESRGGSYGAYGGYNSWGAQVSMMADDLPLAVDVLDEMLRRPTFPEAAVERERAAVLAAIRARQDNPFTVLQAAARHAMYPHHPYRWLSDGTAEAVSAMTRADLEAQHARLLDPRRLVVSVAGDVDPADVLKRLERTLGRLAPPDETWTAPAPPAFDTSGAREVVEERPFTQTLIAVVFPGIALDDPRRDTLEVIGEGLNGQGGRLFQRLRDEQGLAYQVGFFSAPGVDPGFTVFYIATTAELADQALDGLNAQIAALRETGLSPDEVADARHVLRSDQARELQTNESFAFTVALDEVYGLGARHYQGLSQRLEAVTPERTREVARTLFAPERAIVLRVGPPQETPSN